ncbi:cytochrome P450 [Amycolatopsis minnesotensis]|uniref:Cytochrome P450 n=1 Tax=Amycolatopsis minnesotensis TaxID=337894 RepID=A0ABN2QN94_9PSEU
MAQLNALLFGSEDDPYPLYRALREDGPLIRARFGEWLVPRHADVSALLRDPRLSSEFPGEYARLSLPDSPAVDFLERIMLTRNPPAHTGLRRYLSQAFAEPSVRRLREYVAGHAERLLAPALDGEPIDVVEDLGVPLPVLVICALIGVPEPDQHDVWTRVATLNRAFDVPNRTAADIDAMNTGLPWLREYVQGLLDEGRASADGNPLSGMRARGEDPETLRDVDFVDNVLFVLHAGVETSMGLVSNGCAALLSHPGQLARLHAEPGLVHSGIEEFLRYDAPIQSTTRLAKEPIVLGGQKVRPGRAVRLLLGAANRDDAVFERPEELDVTRSPNPHLGFGGGLHHCLGSALARLVGTTVFERMVAHSGSWATSGQPVRRQHANLRSYARLPLLLG